MFEAWSSGRVQFSCGCALGASTGIGEAAMTVKSKSKQVQRAENAQKIRMFSFILRFSFRSEALRGPTLCDRAHLMRHSAFIPRPKFMHRRTSASTLSFIWLLIEVAQHSRNSAGA